MFSYRQSCGAAEPFNGAKFNPSEAITVPQALLLYLGRARRVSPLDQVGLIKEGCEASFVVLDRDIFTIPAAEIDQVQIAPTWVCGEKAWQR